MARVNGFNYTDAVRTVCADMALRIPEFAHIRVERIGFAFRRTKNRKQYGVFACVSPLRFEGGVQVTEKNGSKWRIPEVKGPDGSPLLYLLTVYAPRFIDMPLLGKIDTLVHELYHIGQKFDGDIRRFGDRFYAHGASKDDYNKTVARLAAEWLRHDPPAEIWDFLKFNFEDLAAARGKIIGTRYPITKLIREK